MEVKPGYKQTEVGVIPEEWEFVKIGDLIEKQFILGHLDGNHGELYPRSHEFKSHGVPYVGANDFEEGNVTFARCKFLSDERAARFRKGVARDGDVLFAHNATVGPVALLRTDFPVVILSTTATYFRCNAEKLSNSYLKAALQAQHFVRQYQAVMAQSTRFQVPITAQRKLSLVIAPLPEQRAIAAALSDVDGLLGGLDRLIAKKRDVKQAAMQQLLTGQTRLPGFSGEWELKTLKQAAEINTGINKPISQMGRGALYVTVQDLYDGTSIRIERLGRIRVSPSEIEARALATGDIVFGKSSVKRDGIGYPSQFLGSGEPVVFSGFTYRARARQGTTDAGFLYYSLRSRPTRRWLIDNSQASALTNINQRIADAIPVTLPPLPEQTAIAEVLTEMDGELAGLEQRREKTRGLKQAMMQELLTGRTRLVSP